MQDSLDKIEPLPGILRQPVKLGKLAGIPDPRQRGGKLHGVSRKQHRSYMRAHAVAHAPCLADLGGGIGLAQTAELGDLQADRIAL